jgi:hypothetical protein
MSKRLLKVAIKRAVGAVRRIKTWADETNTDETNIKVKPETRNNSEEGLAYVWLNSQLESMIAEGGTRYFRPNYVWGVLQGAHLAKSLGIERISVIEFGVAGGNGLVALDHIAQRVEDILGVGIDVYGFDTGAGLPKPTDYRDLPNIWVEGAFRMDVEKLKTRLARADLVLGDVENTVPAFIESRPAPVAFIAFDLDYHSSTMQAFKLLEANEALLLPRIYSYFDDIMGHTYSDFTGERLAIREFNSSHTRRKISPIYGLKYFLPKPYDQEAWSEMFYLTHIFDHPLYSRYDGLVKLARFRDGAKLRDDEIVQLNA